ncbi:MAG: hypothetical protein JWR15_527, partial [Prosthecobacter sp.]|nr:hypothetical protein [Prosthecobacter sp.]
HAAVIFSLQDSMAVLQALDLQFDARNNAQVSGALSLLGRQPASLDWNVNIESLADLAPWFAGLPNVPLPQAGTFRSQGKGSGELADLKQQIYTHATAEGTVNAAGIVAQKAHCDSVKIAFSCRDGRVDLNPFEVRLDERNQLTAQGYAMLDKPGDFEFELKAAFEQLESLSQMAPMANASALKSGRAVIAWKANGKTSTGEMNGGGTVEVANVQFEDRPEVLALSLEARQQGRQAQITRLQASAGTFRAEAEANISESQVEIPRLTVFAEKLKLVDAKVQMPLSLKDTSRPFDVSIQVVKMDFTKLFRALHIKAPVTGVANGSVELHGPPSNLDGRVALSLTGVQASATKGKLPPATLQFNATLAKQHLSLDAIVDQKPLQPLRATGGFAFDVDKLINNRAAFLNSAVDVHVTLPQSNLEIVRALTPALEELQGTVGMDVRISGPLRSPRWEGTLLASAPRATFEKTPMDIKDLKAHVSFTGKHIVLEDVSAILAGGQLRAGGSVDVGDPTNPRVDLHLDAQQALLVRDDTMSARADGRVTCRGNLTKAEVTGQVELVRCRVFKEIEFLPLSLPNQLPPPPPAVRTGAPPSLPPPLDQWTLNVDIVTRDAVRLLGNVLNGGATGALRLTGNGAKPQLVGEVSFEGARVRLPNSRLSIKRGKLYFTKEQPFEPQLDVQGDSLVNNYDVTVYASGSALKPKVRFTSSPPLSEPEIAMLLATGSVAGSETTADAAANQAAILLLSKAYRSVFKKAVPRRYDEEPPRLTFKFSPLSTGTTQPGVTANYEISPKVQASGTVTERGTFRGMLYYMVRLR